MENTISVAQATDVGLVRDNNEDALGWFTTPLGELFIVADGMGGYAGGEEASRLAVATVNSFFSSAQGKPEDLLIDAVIAANNAVLEGQATQGLWAMGSTIVIVLVNNYEVCYTHAGDSRLYLYSQGKLRQLTHDHSYVQQLVDEGVITPEQAEHHPQKNIITVALGGEIDPAALTIGRFTCSPGDILLLCTDGLTNMLPDSEISAILSQDAQPRILAQQLLDQALAAGGYDNITLQIIVFRQTAEQAKKK